MTTSSDAYEPKPKQRDNLALWGGLLLPPIAWGLHFQINYTLVENVCQHPEHRYLLYVCTGGALVVSLIGGLLAFLEWRRARPRVMSELEAGDPVARAAFMAAMGLGSSALFSLTIV